MWNVPSHLDPFWDSKNRALENSRRYFVILLGSVSSVRGATDREGVRPMYVCTVHNCSQACGMSDLTEQPDYPI